MSGFEQFGLARGSPVSQGGSVPEALGVPFRRALRTLWRRGWVVLAMLFLGVGVLGDMGTLVHRMPSGLLVMSTGASRRNPQDLLASTRMSQLIKWSREEFDLVRLDAPPVLAVADPLIVARQVDAVMLAVRWDRTPPAAVRRALGMLQVSGVRMLGSVLTQVHIRRIASRGDGVAHVFRDYRTYHQTRG